MNNDIKLKILKKKFLMTHLNEFEDILIGLPFEKDKTFNFSIELKRKWDFSLVAVNSDCSILGYLIASEKDTSVHIHKFMVNSNYRGQKIGDKLLSKFESICIKNNRSIISLKVHNDNTRAINFYIKNNFVIVSKNEYYYMEKYILK
jgi:ribosomal-protein-alanine N-acetyltransferase